MRMLISMDTDNILLDRKISIKLTTYKPNKFILYINKDINSIQRKR